MWGQYNQEKGTLKIEVTLVWFSAAKERYSLFGAAAAVAIQSCLPFTPLQLIAGCENSEAVAFNDPIAGKLAEILSLAVGSA